MTHEIWRMKEGKFIKAWTRGVTVDPGAITQLEETAKLPFIYRHIAVMPDVHQGIGSTVGSVIPTKGAIIPAAVGVDIGCGMMATQLDLTADELPDNLAQLRAAIESAVPHGRSDGSITDKGSWKRNIPKSVQLCFNTLRDELTNIYNVHPKLKGALDPRDQACNMLGTLGTGNHFIEICLDEDNNVWVMLHSGSRGIGNRIGSYFITKAKEEMERWHINLSNKDLAYLPEGTELFQDYWQALNWAQEYARLNRQLMMCNVRGAIEKTLSRGIDDGKTAVECHHNYATRENHFGQNIIVTRKGAVCARKGKFGIIPGSMGAKSYIVKGLGNKDSFTSCSHGAGRVMSRRKARDLISIEEHIRATEGVECKKDASVIDESPAAYKNIDTVMEAQKDLVEVVHTLKQVVCVKG